MLDVNNSGMLLGERLMEGCTVDPVGMTEGDPLVAIHRWQLSGQWVQSRLSLGFAIGMAKAKRGTCLAGGLDRHGRRLQEVEKLLHCFCSIA